ncbi:hypothetical protein OG216_22435 [Streptomycetaceae bacterium NBC_01309]
MSTPIKRVVASLCATAAITGCLVTSGTAVQAERPAPLEANAAALPAAADGRQHPTQPLNGYRSRPDLVNAGLTSLGGLPVSTSTEAFFGYQRNNTNGEYRESPVIHDSNGAPVWIGANNGPTCLCPAVPIRFRGQAAFAFLNSSGTWQVLDASYRKVFEIPGFAAVRNSDWFITTNPEGTRALVTGNRTFKARLPEGTSDVTVGASLVKEIDLLTGDVLFSWDSQTAGPGFVPLTDTVRFRSKDGVAHHMDVDAVGWDADGGILLTARGTRAIYKIDRSGAVVWTFGGKHSSFEPAPGTSAPVDPRSVRRNPDGTLSYLELHDAVGGPVHWVTVSLDETARTAALVTSRELERTAIDQDYGKYFLVQTLANGSPAISDGMGNAAEYTSGSDLAAWTHPKSGMGTNTLRAPWQGTPQTKPDLGLDMTSATGLSAYASWNGATEVAKWRVSVGPGTAGLRVVGEAARTGFETRVNVEVTAADSTVRVEALDVGGRVIATTDKTLSPITLRYGQLGGANSALGLPTSQIEAWQGGFRQHFVGGDIYWRADTGARVVLGAIAKRMDEIGAAAGFPLADTAKDSRGYLSQLLTSGGMYSRVLDMAEWVTGAEWTKYSAMNREKGVLGFPKEDVLVQSDGSAAQLFDGGEIHRASVGGRTRVVEIHGAIYTLWKQQRREGVPTTDEIATPDGVGRFNAFTDNRGRNWSIYWTPRTGAHAVRDEYRAKWGAVGWEGGIGYPVSEQGVRPGAYIPHQDFERGSLYPNANGRSIQVVQGAIRDKYGQTGWSAGWLGSPLTDELVTPDGYGRFNQFPQGCIYWTPRTGAQALSAQTREEWMHHGWELGWLGYPVTSSAPTPDGIGEHTHFERGSIYWARRPYQTGYWFVSGTVRGDIRAKYASLGWERSRLGYPVADEYEYARGKVGQRFENGLIIWDARTRATTVQYL